MPTDGPAAIPSPANRFRWQRVAELVANDLRTRILGGDLDDGDQLPKEEELRAEYQVSKPSLREAMRILEAEGLLTVRRGNMGGALVHRPSATNVAYTLAMVLRTDDVGIDDVAQALREVEPACAALCAEVTGRKRTIVPELRAIQKEARQSVDDLVRATDLSRQFHETIVRRCGNRSLIVMVGALEAVWSSHETGWSRAVDPQHVPVEERRAALDRHDELIARIAAGDASGARELSWRHLCEVQQYPDPDSGDGHVVPALVRDRFN